MFLERRTSGPKAASSRRASRDKTKVVKELTADEGLTGEVAGAMRAIRMTYG